MNHGDWSATIKVDRPHRELRTARSRTASGTSISRQDWEEMHAGRFARRAAATAESTWIHGDGGHHSCLGHRSHNGDLHPRAPGNAQIAAGHKAGGAVEDR